MFKKLIVYWKIYYLQVYIEELIDELDLGFCYLLDNEKENIKLSIKISQRLITILKSKL